MGIGAFTRYIDVPQVVLYVFWIFFAGLILYLRREDKREGYPLQRDPSNGTPQPPAGNPMVDAAGPASYSQRQDVPDVTVDGKPLIVPMRVAAGFTVAAEDEDPRGMVVVGADGVAAGKVLDIWVDRAEPQIRYLEVKLDAPLGGRSVLLPIGYLKFNQGRRTVQVASILSSQFATVPALANPDVVTLLEEDRITAYYAGGQLYAEPSRLGPIL
jgi:photosynthetic reaction center H subunit